MRHVYIKTRGSQGEIAQVSEAYYDHDGTPVPFPEHLGPFEVSDEFGMTEESDMAYYRVKDNALVMDADAIRRRRQEKEQMAREEKRVWQRQKAAAYLQEMQAEEVAKSTSDVNKIIILTSLLPAWEPKPYAVGDIVQYEDVPYRCVQAHNSTGNLSWNPMDARALWANYHAKSSENALPWIQPTGAHDAYQTGEWMIWTDEKTYKCTGMAVVHGPDAAPQLWSAM